MKLPARACRRGAAAAAFAIFACSGVLAQRIEVTPNSRMFRVTMTVVFNAIPPHLQRLNFWFPMPFQDDSQAIYNRFIMTAYGPEFHYSPDTGNEYIYMNSPPRGGKLMHFQFNFDVEKFEDLRNDFRPREENRPTPEEEKEIYERWLREETGIEIDSDTKKLAREITNGRKKTQLKARAIYDYIVSEFSLQPDPDLIGELDPGDLAAALASREGDSIDLAAVFVGLCRAIEIPARTVYGLKVPVADDSGPLKTYHGWAEFYLEGTGWIPVDPADGQRNPSRRIYYFGALDENRITVSIGRDIMLVPPQEDDPLKYMIRPYWEGDAQAMTLPSMSMEFEVLEEIPNKGTMRVPSPARLPPEQPAGESPPDGDQPE